MIPAATLDTITSALKAEGLTGQLMPPMTPTEDIQKSLARHADKEAVWYADASLVTPAAKRNIMKALGSLGVTVTAYGILVPFPTGENGALTTNRVDGDTPPAPETLAADGAEVEVKSTPAPDAEPKPTVAPDAVPEPSKSTADHLVYTASVDAAPAKPRKVSAIKLDIQPADLDVLLNDETVTILCTGFNGDKLNVAYYREV